MPDEMSSSMRTALSTIALSFLPSLLGDRVLGSVTDSCVLHLVILLTVERPGLIAGDAENVDSVSPAWRGRTSRV